MKHDSRPDHYAEHAGRAVGAVAVALLLAAGCSTAETRSAADAGATNGAQKPEGSARRILYESVIDDQSEVMLINEDGTGLTRLTDNPGYDGMPSWTPGGDVLFVSDRGAGPGQRGDVYLMRADGTRVRQIAPSEVNEGYVSWTSDSRALVYDSFRDGPPEIYRGSIENGEVVQLTSLEAHIGDPRLSPDGSLLTFESGRDGNSEIYVTNADGSDPQRLTDNPGDDRASAISPDNLRIIFSSDRGGEREAFELWVMDRDGSNLSKLTESGTSNLYATFEPRGRDYRIVFTSERDGNSEIYRMNADGSGLTRLTNNPAEESLPYCSPDGSRIVFSSDRDNTRQLYLMDIDGGNHVRLTNNDYDNNSPAWSPDGSEIAFSSGGNATPSNLFTIRPDGSNERQVTNREGYNFLSPTWSPDGSRLGAEGGRLGETLQTEWGEAGRTQIWTFNADGSDAVQLTQLDAYNGYPAWSPIGSHIVFDSTLEGWADILSVSVADQSVANLTNDPRGERVRGLVTGWVQDRIRRRSRRQQRDLRDGRER